MSPTTTRPQAAPERFMQGVMVPASSVNRDLFFAKTRKHQQTESVQSYDSTNPPATLTVPLLRSDILSRITIRFVGQIVTAKGSGTVVTGRRWPYDFLKAVRFSANGVSNLINVSGLKLKMREVAKRGDMTDRGVSQTIGSTTYTQGTLARASESWGVGSGATIGTDGTYPVDLTWEVPVAEDEFDLAGAIFLATSSTDLSLSLDLATPAELWTLTSNATATLTGKFQIETTKFSIPLGDNGQIVVPDLSLFHSLIQSRSTDLQIGEIETKLVGVGQGQQLLRLYWQLWNGSPSAPLVQSDANFGTIAWRYGSNETPERIYSGGKMRQLVERLTNSDAGGPHGFGMFDFAGENAFRDTVDLGTVSDLRLVNTIASGVTLTSPALEYVTERVFLSGQSA